jgi:hypothetical protein
MQIAVSLTDTSRPAQCFIAVLPLSTFGPAHPDSGRRPVGELADGWPSRRSVLCHIRVCSKHELKQRITQFIDDLNRAPVVHRWYYQIETTK